MPRSIVLITIDCLRADHVGFLGYDRPTTPFLDSLAPGSVVFSNAIVAGAPTYYSFPSLMASRYPLLLGRDVVGLAPNERSLATVMKENGYATAAFLAGNPYLSPRFGYDAGFEEFCDFLDPRTSTPGITDAPAAASSRPPRSRGLAELFHKLGPLGSLYDELYFQYCLRAADTPQSLDQLRRFPSAHVIVDRARAWLAEVGDRPFFLWLHLMDPHSPYYPTEAALAAMGQGRLAPSRARYLNSSWNRGDLAANRLQRYRDELVCLYDAGIRWVDTQVARLVDALRESGTWADCVFALTADHGEEFLDHGGRYHPPSRAYEEVVRVPLLLHGPGAFGKRVDAPFSLIHLAPTLLEAASLDACSDFRGRSHWTSLQQDQSWRDSFAIIENVSGCSNPFREGDRLGARIMAVRESRYKLVLDLSSASEQLFDLERDPKELCPLAATDAKPERKRLLDIARTHLAESSRLRDADLRLSARLRDIQLEWANSSDRISA